MCQKGTVITCTNAAGTYVGLKLQLMDGAPPGTISSCQPSSWIQQHVFTEWFLQCLSFAKPTNKDPGVLVSDGHYSHTWMLLT
jgi:hypothetical protein